MILSSADALDFCQYETLGFISHKLHLYFEVITDCFLPEFVNWFIKLLEYFQILWQIQSLCTKNHMF